MIHSPSSAGQVPYFTQIRKIRQDRYGPRKSDWSTLQSVCHASLDDAELGSIGVEVIRELGLRGLRRHPAS